MSLERQIYDKNLFEVIVINDGSTDLTEQFLDSFQKQTIINFRVITQPNKGVSAARNAGIEIAEGEHIAFTDDDCILPDNWLINMHKDLDSASKDTAGVGGPLNSVSNKNSFIGKFISFLDEFNYVPVIGKYFIRPVHISRLTGYEQISYLRTSNAMFRKVCLNEIGGFDQYFNRPGGEDPDLCYRLLTLNYRFYFDKDLAILHQSRDSFISYFRSLKNYLKGEIRKSCKKETYKIKPIQRTYTLLPVQKIFSFFLSLVSYPSTFFRILKKSDFSLFHALLFPAIIVCSKLYAFIISSYYYIKFFRCRGS
ncbi:MAG: glycosyltransferase [Nitrospirota bacterium]